jgi:hypothetical protein
VSICVDVLHIPTPYHAQLGYFASTPYGVSSCAPVMMPNYATNTLCGRLARRGVRLGDNSCPIQPTPKYDIIAGRADSLLHVDSEFRNATTGIGSEMKVSFLMLLSCSLLPRANTTRACERQDTL